MGSQYPRHRWVHDDRGRECSVCGLRYHTIRDENRPIGRRARGKFLYWRLPNGDRTWNRSTMPIFCKSQEPRDDQ